MSRRGFSMIELVAAVAIAATALVALQATMGGAILMAGDSINRRAAREKARAKLEEILAGVESPDGGGTFEDTPNFQWSARTEELQIGMPEAQTEVVRVVVLEVSFPVEAGGEEELGAGGTDKITLATVLRPDPAQPAPAGPQ